jgi:phosphohistidine swiveling domain-containing protein
MFRFPLYVLTLVLSLGAAGLLGAEPEARFEPGEKRWSLSNGLIEANFRLTPPGNFVLESLSDLRTGDKWTAPAGVTSSMWRLRAGGVWFDGSTPMRLIKYATTGVEPDGLRLSILLEDMAGLGRFELNLELYGNHPVLRYYTRFTNLRGLAALRKAEYASFGGMPAPDGRFETRGMVNAGHGYQTEAPAEAPAGIRRTGTGCCPGTVSGRVRVIEDPHRESPERGEILVAERTDPGWILVFPFAAGIIVEHGSMLSHTAIVAREMGIPAVVSLAGATSWLRTGDHVQLDGASGEVVKVAYAEQCA